MWIVNDQIGTSTQRPFRASFTGQRNLWTRNDHIKARNWSVLADFADTGLPDKNQSGLVASDWRRAVRGGTAESQSRFTSGPVLAASLGMLGIPSCKGRGQVPLNCSHRFGTTTRPPRIGGEPVDSDKSRDLLRVIRQNSRHNGTDSAYE